MGAEETPLFDAGETLEVDSDAREEIEIRLDPPEQERASPFDIEEEGLDHYTSEQYLTATTNEYRDLAAHVARLSEQQHEQQAVSMQVPGLDTGVVGFEDVTGESAAVMTEEPSDLPIRMLTGGVLGALFLGVLWMGGWWFVALATVIAVMALGEFYATARKRRFNPAALFGLAGGVVVMVSGYLTGPAGLGGVVAGMAVLISLWYALGLVRRDPLANAAVTLFGLAWIPGLIAFALPMLRSIHFQPLLLAVVGLTVAQDAGAYFAGRAWGRTPMAPRLSPHKTVEGLLGGFFVTFAASLALVPVDPFDLRSALALAAAVALFAPMGDLAESMVKRSLAVKDMGSLLPGHGGLLDRIDALLFVVPAAYLVYRWLGFLA